MYLFYQRVLVAYHRTYGCIDQEQMLAGNYTGRLRDLYLEGEADPTVKAATEKEILSRIRYQRYLEHPISIMSEFFGWPVIPTKRKHKQQPQTVYNEFLNLIGWEADARWFKKLSNALLALPNLIWHLFIGLFITAKNIIKLFTEFLPSLLVSELEYRHFISRSKLVYMGWLLSYIIRFIGTAVTSPLKGFAAADQLGDYFGRWLFNIAPDDQKSIIPVIFVVATCLLSAGISMVSAAVLYPWAASWLLSHVPALNSALVVASTWASSFGNILPPIVMALSNHIWHAAKFVAEPIVRYIFSPIIRLLGNPISISQATTSFAFFELVWVYSMASWIENHIKLSKTYKDLTREPYMRTKRDQAEVEEELTLFKLQAGLLTKQEPVKEKSLGQAFPTVPVGANHAVVFSRKTEAAMPARSRSDYEFKPLAPAV